ncbi:hypothetical protein MTR67_052271 [Solanum verrucosum]|uniref:DUF4283 domain-containing protein n=1 Tax=Solanum verrucosum TaxID=315347 RepID=A0AAF0V909_SOLVR|nr:hypothetical protein MTR67_052271 [Solanum verrucosum]
MTRRFAFLLFHRRFVLAFNIFTFWTIGQYSTASQNYSSQVDPPPSHDRTKESRLRITQNGLVLVWQDSAADEAKPVSGGDTDTKSRGRSRVRKNVRKHRGRQYPEVLDHRRPFTREELRTVPIWIKLPGLDFKYWSPKGLSKIGSLVGKPIMVDHNTERKVGLNFARLLLEVEMDTTLPEVILFRSEKGNLIEQKVLYDWKPTLCKEQISSPTSALNPHKADILDESQNQSATNIWVRPLKPLKSQTKQPLDVESKKKFQDLDNLEAGLLYSYTNRGNISVDYLRKVASLGEGTDNAASMLGSINHAC